MLTVTVAVALGAGVVAGVFFAFSAFVMKAVGTLPAAEGIAAMQAINVAAVTPAFMIVLFGTAIGAVALVVDAATGVGPAAANLRLAGGLVYLAGPVAVTIAYHVPRNDRLASVEPDGVDAPALWARYATGWTSVNHLRAAAALTTAGLLTVAAAID